MNKAICLFAFKSELIKNGVIERKEDDSYINSAIKNIAIYKKYPVDIVVLTDSPSYFKNLDVEVVTYFEYNKSYADKLHVCDLALRKYNTILYIDSDITLDISKFCEMDFEPGFHYTEEWLDGISTYEEMKKDFDCEYFEHIENYCNENEMNINDVRLIGERFFVISKNIELNTFFAIFNQLKTQIIENDFKFNNRPVGRGEGLIIGVSILNSEMPLYKTTHLKQIIKKYV